MEIIREWAGQSAFLASILAGFAVAAMLQLIGYSGERKVANYAVLAFVVSAALVLAATAVTSVMLMRWEYWQQASLPQQAMARDRAGAQYDQPAGLWGAGAVPGGAGVGGVDPFQGHGGGGHADRYHHRADRLLGHAGAAVNGFPLPPPFRPTAMHHLPGFLRRSVIYCPYQLL